MIPDKVVNVLFGIVDHIVSSSLSSPERKQFPFAHYTSSAIDCEYYQTVLVPDGYLEAFKCTEFDMCYQLTPKGYETIRGLLTRELQAQGDAYYGYEVIE